MKWLFYATNKKAGPITDSCYGGWIMGYWQAHLSSDSAEVWKVIRGPEDPRNPGTYFDDPFDFAGIYALMKNEQGRIVAVGDNPLNYYDEDNNYIEHIPAAYSDDGGLNWVLSTQNPYPPLAKYSGGQCDEMEYNIQFYYRNGSTVTAVVWGPILDIVGFIEEEETTYTKGVLINCKGIVQIYGGNQGTCEGSSLETNAGEQGFRKIVVECNVTKVQESNLTTPVPIVTNVSRRDLQPDTCGSLPGFPPGARGSYSEGGAYGNGTFIIAGDTGHIWSSMNGVDWTLRYGNGIQLDPRGVEGHEQDIDGNPYDATAQDYHSCAGYAFVNNTHVHFAGTDTGVIRRSVDGGITWANVYIDPYYFNIEGGATACTKSIAGGNNICIVMLGQTRDVERISAIYSEDSGSTWQEIPNFPITSNNNYYGGEIKFIQGKFYAAGDDGRIATSGNGLNWTLLSNNPLEEYNIYTPFQISTLAYHSKQNKIIFARSDGTLGILDLSNNTWELLRPLEYVTEQNSPFRNSPLSLLESTVCTPLSNQCLRPGWLVGGSLLGITDKTLQVWKQIKYTTREGEILSSLSDEDYIWNAARKNEFGRIVAATRNNIESGITGNRYFPIAYSDDKGLTWVVSTESTSGNDIVLNDIDANENFFVAVGDNGRVYRSSTGESWVQVRGEGFNGSNNQTDDVLCIYVDQNVYFIGTTNGQIYTTGESDPTTWYKIMDIPEAGMVYSVRYSGASIVAVTPNGWYQSTDFTTWNNYAPPEASIISNNTYKGYSGTLIYNNGLYFIGALYGEIYFSEDEGVTETVGWTLIPNNPLQVDRESAGSDKNPISVISYNKYIDKYFIGQLSSSQGGRAALYDHNTGTWSGVITSPPGMDHINFMRFALPIATGACISSI